MDELLLYFKSHAFYEDFEENVLSHRPVVPNYNPSEDNTEKWKFESAKQEGFDLCLTLFKIGVKDE